MKISRFSFLILFLFTAACLQTENSSSTDRTYKATPEFRAAREVFSQTCAAPCHFHNFHGMTSDELVDEGFAVAQDLENSKIYYRISGSTALQGPKNMPTSGSITPAEIEAIEEWINSLD